MDETKIELEKTKIGNPDLSWGVEEKFLHGDKVKEALDDLLEKIKQQEQMTPVEDFDLDDLAAFHEAKEYIWNDDEKKKQFGEKQLELEKE